MDRNIKGNLPDWLYFYQLLKLLALKYLKIHPGYDKKAEAWIKDHNDAPILAAARIAKVDVV